MLKMTKELILYMHDQVRKSSARICASGVMRSVLFDGYTT